MHLNNYHNKLELYDISEYNSSKELFFNELRGELKKQKIYADIIDNKLVFKNKIGFTTHTGKNKLEIFKLLNEGHITIQETNHGIVLIEYVALLKSAVFLGLGTAVLSIIYSLFFLDKNLFNAFLLGCVIYLCIYFIYYFLTKQKLDDIVMKAIKKISPAFR